MRKIILIGGGGHCKSCIDVIEQENKYQILGVIDNNDKINSVLSYPILGCDKDLKKFLSKSILPFISIGQIKTPSSRIEIFNLLKKQDSNFPTIISPHAYCSKYVKLGEGTIIMHGAIINSDVFIGDNCIINSKALIEHDVNIGPHCHISTGAKINGGVSIGEGSFIGSGAIIKEGISVRKNTIIGAGKIVLQNV